MSTILIVDDELNMRLFLKTLLETNGHVVVTAKDGKQGLALAEEHRPALVILDVMMPGQGGLAMYRALRTSDQFKAVPVIMLSAVAGTAFKEALQMLGAAGEDLPSPQGYVQKPPTAEAVMEEVRGILGDAETPVAEMESENP